MTKKPKKFLTTKSISLMVALCICAATPVYADDGSGHYRDVTGAEIIKKITGLPPQLFSVALNNQKNLIYLTGYNYATGVGSLIVMNGFTHQIINQITSPTLNASLVVDEKTGTVWAFSNNGGSTNSTVIQYSGVTLQALKTVQLNNVNTNVVAFNRRTGKFYVTNYSNGEIEVYDRNLNHLLTIADDNSNYVAINEKTNRIYVTNYWDATVSVIDGRTDTLVGNPIPVGQAITPDDCYKASQSSTYPFYPSCTNYNTFAATDGIAVDQDTGKIFVANVNDGQFVTIDGKTNQVVSTLQLEEGIYNVVTMPGYNAALGINWDRSTLSVVDEKQEKRTDTVQVGAPDSANCLRIQWDGGNCSYWGDLTSGITVSEDNQTIYVIDSGSQLENPDPSNPHANSTLYILKPISLHSEVD